MKLRVIATSVPFQIATSSLNNEGTVMPPHICYSSLFMIRLKIMVHCGPLEVVYCEKYRQWCDGWGGEVKHIYAGR